jgi:hypothetical protein
MARDRLVRTGLVAAVRDARISGRIGPDHEPMVSLALKVAGRLDALGADAPIMELVRLTRMLRDLLKELPLREVVPGDGRPAGDSAAERDARPAGLAVVVGSVPEVGDRALP